MTQGFLPAATILRHFDLHNNGQLSLDKDINHFVGNRPSIRSVTSYTLHLNKYCK